jgi:uncharacterized protein (DUF697 family)
LRTSGASFERSELRPQNTSLDLNSCKTALFAIGTGVAVDAVRVIACGSHARPCIRLAKPVEDEMQNPLSEYNPEMEMFESEQFEWSGETTGEVVGEGELMELAAELLEVRDEQELDRFLGSVFKKVKAFAGSAAGKAVGGMLKGVLKKALPIAGGLAGTFFGGPVGATIGNKLGSMAGNLFEMELEGLSQEDREFEAAKQFARFAADAVQNAATAPGGNPIAIARSAIATAAQRHAPGLLNGSASSTPMSSAPPMRSHSTGTGRPHSGRWRRIGPNRIIVENC